MAGIAFDFQVGKGLARRLQEAHAAAARIEDRVKRADLETDARFAGTLLAALAAAERALRAAPDLPSFGTAAEAYLGQLERAEAAVASVRERALSEAPAASARAPGSPEGF